MWFTCPWKLISVLYSVHEEILILLLQSPRSWLRNELRRNSAVGGLLKLLTINCISPVALNMFGVQSLACRPHWGLFLLVPSRFVCKDPQDSAYLILWETRGWESCLVRCEHKDREEKVSGSPWQNETRVCFSISSADTGSVVCKMWALWTDGTRQRFRLLSDPICTVIAKIELWTLRRSWWREAAGGVCLCVVGCGGQPFIDAFMPLG